MKEFDYIIIGAGCAGLSLAYELEIYEKLKTTKLAIIETRSQTKKYKKQSSWNKITNKYKEGVKERLKNFIINSTKNDNNIK